MPAKLNDLLVSRKFWALVFGLVTLGISYQFGHIPLEQAELGVLAILSAYIGGTAIEAHGAAMATAPPPVVNLTVHPSSLTPTAGVTFAGSGSVAAPALHVCAGGK